MTRKGVVKTNCFVPFAQCALVYIGETGRNLSSRLKELKTELEKSAAAKHSSQNERID